MSSDTSEVPALLQRIHAEWEAHAGRHRAGRGWGVFRSLASVLQVAGTLILVVGVLAQAPSFLAALGQDWVYRFVPTPAELAILAIFVAPEWFDVYCFGRADRVLRSYGVLKRLDTDPPPLPPVSALRLRTLWTGQILSRLTNLAVHVLFAVAISSAIFLGARGVARESQDVARPATVELVSPS